MPTRWLVVFLVAVLVVGCGPSAVAVDEGEPSFDRSGVLTISSPDDHVTVRDRVVTVTGTASDGTDIVRDVILGRDSHATALNGRWSMDVELDEGDNLLTFRVGDDKGTSATLFLVYAPAVAAVESAQTSAGPAKTPEAKPSAKPATTPAPKPTAKPVATSAPKAGEPTALSVKVVSRTRSVARNATASVTIKTTKRARCSIDVEYLSGPSTAAGLGDKTADSSGGVTWKWKVGGRTTKGTWPIYIVCDLGDRSGEVDTEFTVR